MRRLVYVLAVALWATAAISTDTRTRDDRRTLNDHSRALVSKEFGSAEAHALFVARSLLEKRATGSDDHTCGPGRPCKNGACCGQSGWCGYSPEFCGTGCQSNCDAKAECGQYAKVTGAGCPLNVCCSEFGFCGTTAEFCGKGCQSHCTQPKPSASSSNPRDVILAYYEGWNSQRSCGTMSIDEIPVTQLTHLNFAFGFISPGTYRIENMVDVDASLFQQITDIKKRNKNIKVMIALGGWTHNDPGPYQKVFSDLASSGPKRTIFIKNVLGFLNQYGFDGVDIDWEYPGADDRGGTPADTRNYVLLLQEMKAAFKNSIKDYILTFTAPTSYWYLRHFDIKAMADAVNWINLMSYDLHGVWDGNNYIGNQVLGHTNLTEIDQALDLFWRNNVLPQQIVLGMGFYGRTFELQDTKCWTPGCRFTAAGEAGPCTGTNGILSYKEVSDILRKTKAKPYFDKQAALQVLTYGSNSWVSYDDPTTIDLKVDFAQKRGLKGLMTWALDTDNESRDLLKAMTGNRFYTDEDTHSDKDGTQCYVTECKATCKQGYTAVSRKSSDINGKNDCAHGTNEESQARYICCPTFTGITEGQCRWDFSHSDHTDKDCSAKCNIGEVKIGDDSYGWTGDLHLGTFGSKCRRGARSFCCTDPNMAEVLKICEWSECARGCPSTKPYVLTKDTGGPDRKCGKQYVNRSLCCPNQSFKNCGWRADKECSGTCPNGQITLDLDPIGSNTNSIPCYWGRMQAFCCDPIGGKDRPFAPFNVENLFPEKLRPHSTDYPTYDLQTFGGHGGSKGRTDPNTSGVAFFFMAGADAAVSSMHKRSNPGLEVVDCPTDIFSKPTDETQTARVVCVDSDPDECFKVRLGGVEGTIVQMPDDCGGPSWARAVALTPSANQTLPDHLSKRKVRSVVYDFAFDYDIALAKRDTGDMRIRIDYSNVPGYWDAVVNTPGKEKRDLKQLVDRFYSSKSADWWDKFSRLDLRTGDGLPIKVKLDNLVYHEKAESCNNPADGGVGGESLSIALQGDTNLTGFFGFSMIATYSPGNGGIKVEQSAGFLEIQGKTDVSFKMGGIGALNTLAKLKGGEIRSIVDAPVLLTQQLFNGWAEFSIYRETEVTLESRGAVSDPGVAVRGYLEARAAADWGQVTVGFPDGGTDNISHGSGWQQRQPTQLNPSTRTEIFPGIKRDGAILVGTSTRIGLRPYLVPGHHRKRSTRDLVKRNYDAVPDMSVSQHTYVQWTLQGDSSKVCLTTSVGTVMQSQLSGGQSLGWIDKSNRYMVTELDMPTGTGAQQCFTGSGVAGPGSGRLNKMARDSLSALVKDSANVRANLTKLSPELVARGPGGIGWDFGNDTSTPGDNLRDPSWDLKKHQITCQEGCQTCVWDINIEPPCCNCYNIPLRLGFHQQGRPDPELQYDITFSGSSKKRSSSAIALEEVQGQAANLTLDKSIATDELDELDEDLLPEPHLLKGSHLCEKESCEPATPVSLAERAEGASVVKRAPVSISTKRAVICGQPVEGATYPSYPNYKRFPDNDKDFDNSAVSRDVLKYFHNSSYSCLSWAVAQFPASDRTWRDDLQPPKWGEAFYETEHPFEAQTISRFFDEWLPNDAQTKRTCNGFSRTQAVINPAPAQAPGQTMSLARLMMFELGSRANPRRLAVFVTNSNRLKGTMAGDKDFLTDWGNYPAGDAQLAAAKEVGMIFTYLNMDIIWNAWCDTYNGILDHLVVFDNNRGTDLAVEWPKFVRSELNMWTERARAQLRFMYANKKPKPGAWQIWWNAQWHWVFYEGWGDNRPGNQMAYIKLDKACRRLP